MTDVDETDEDLVGDEFELLGRQAGAELRQQPPVDGPAAILRTARRRRATTAVVAAGATVSIVVTGLFVVASSPDDGPAPVATVPPTPVATVPTPVVTTVPPPLEDVAPPDAPRATTPGTWREVADSTLAPDFAAAAVWTGTEAIVIGSNTTMDSGLFAAAYDLGQDRWRRIADLPPAITQHSLGAVAPALQWTGTEVLTATSTGEVYAYDPELDRWETRARAGESVGLVGGDVLVAVSARGVLVRSATGWWWYENSTDRWESVPSPSDADEYSMLGALDQNRIVASLVDGSTITSAVFDIATRAWRTGPPVAGAPNPGQLTCSGNDGLLVCAGEGSGSYVGVVIDPLVGAVDTFRLGPHENTFTVTGLPWIVHAAKLLAPRTATWEDLPPIPRDLEGFGAAVWTGSEIVFFGGTEFPSDEWLGATAAYTPLQLPGR